MATVIELVTLVTVIGIASEKLFNRLNMYHGIRQAELRCFSCCSLNIQRQGTPNTSSTRPPYPTSPATIQHTTLLPPHHNEMMNFPKSSSSTAASTPPDTPININQDHTTQPSAPITPQLLTQLLLSHIANTTKNTPLRDLSIHMPSSPLTSISINSVKSASGNGSRRVSLEGSHASRPPSIRSSLDQPRPIVAKELKTD